MIKIVCSLSQSNHVLLLHMQRVHGWVINIPVPKSCHVPVPKSCRMLMHHRHTTLATHKHENVNKL